MSFGKPNYDKNKGFKKKNYFNVDESELIVAILPPLHSLAEKGVWSRFYKLHFGYKNLEGKLRTFISPEVKNHKTKMIDVPDAALDRINDLKLKMEAAKKEGNTTLSDRLNKLVGMKGVYNVDNNHHMNVHDLSGKIGVLKIRHRCKLALDAEIEKLRKQGVDPLDLDNGRYFVIQRVGTGPDTSFKVTVYEQEIDVPGYGKMKQAVTRNASADLRARALSGEAADLDDLFQTVTADECKAIVNESDLLTGVSPACNRIFDDRWKAERATRPGVAATTTTTTAVAPAAATSIVDPADEEPDSDPAPVAQKSAPVAAAATQVAQETRLAQAAPKAPTPSSFAEMSDDDFFAAVGAPKKLA